MINMPPIDPNDPLHQFYTLSKEATKENLNFIDQHLQCIRCGKCCSDLYGEVISPSELEQLAYRLKISRNAFKKAYTITYDGIRVLKGPCPFLVNNQCSVYEDRPRICRTFPLNRQKLIAGKMYIQICNCPSGSAFIKQYVQGTIPTLEKGG